MTLRSALVAVAALGFWGCETISSVLPPAQDGGTLTVPGGYHLARMTPGHRAHLALEGEQRVPCRDCHALADAGFAAPPVTICAGCHEAQQRQHHPLDAGVSMSCLTCHVFLAKEPGVRFEKWGCMGCHAEAQGTKAAITVHLERCDSCHRPHEVPFTAPADCTSCHAVTLVHGAKGDSVAQTCMNCHPPHSKAPVASQQCLSCHAKAEMTLAARVSPQALFPDGHAGCGTCHTPHTFQKNAVKPCSSCHEKRLVLAPDSHAKCDTCHQPHQPMAQPKPCVSCHQKISATLKHPASAEGQTCTGCHVAHPAEPGPIAVPCLSCHQEPELNGHPVHAATLSCDSCHPPHGGKPKREVLCVTCHEDQVLAAKQNKGHADCNQCHAGLPHAESEAPKPCLNCHQDKVPPQKKHPECATCHASHSAKVIATCASCHLSPTSDPLPGLHAVQKHRECKTCHAAHTPEPSRGPAACVSCHRRLPQASHPTPPTQCVGCHLFTQEK